MGSAKVSGAKPQLPMAENTDKKSIKTLLKSLFHKDKKKDKTKKEKETEVIIKESPIQTSKPNPVETLLENLEKLQLEKKESIDNLQEERKENDEEDEFNNFSIKVIEDEGRTERIASQSSEDSGFSEKEKENQVEEIGEALENLDIKDDKASKKRLRTVVTDRKPNRIKCNYKVKPYSTGQDLENAYRQVSLNKRALSGGAVIVNSTQSTDDFDNSEVVIACNSVEKISQHSQKENGYWQDVLELINEDIQPKYDAPTPQSDILSDFQVEPSENFEINVAPTEIPEPNPVEEFTYTNHLSYEDSIELTSIFDETAILMDNERSRVDSYIFPTPPRSENVPSPMSGSPSSFYPPNSDYTQSPERYSPTYNSDSEKYQDISQFTQSPSFVEDSEKKTRERTASICSMTMKNFKDMQKDIASSFSKRECCQTNRRPCRAIFQECLQRLKQVERKNLCFQVAKMELNTIYGVLQNILLALSRDNEQEDLRYALFSLICERVLAQKPSLFAEEFGLRLIKSAALRCPHRAVLTRYLAQCVRAALRVEPALARGKDYIFHEVDSQGDNLLIACARAGDSCAAVLFELVHEDTPGETPPLFRLEHANADGYTALHVASSSHGAGSKRLVTAHVLLHHAQADLWKGDIKGGDTALHLAVNSATCDLQLIMIMFKHIDRKKWKKLAHYQNMGGVTPLELARLAIKSSTRPDYPQEVLDFLKKCR